MDNWSKAMWHVELEKYHVLVMTMTIFKNLILQNILKFNQVNLLVFDECHHAVKNHDYVQIMKRYKDTMDTLHPTRIMGLTASLIPSKGKQVDLVHQIELLENTLCSRAQTTANMSEMAKFATNPDEKCICFSSSNEDYHVEQLQKMLENSLEFLDQFSMEKRRGDNYEMVRINIEDCLHILLDLGIWCAHGLAVQVLQSITTSINECYGCHINTYEMSILYFGHTQLTLFERSSREKAFLDSNKIHVTDKANKVLIALGNASKDGSGCGNEGGRLCGIIFTERRMTAISLRDLLQKQSEVEPGLRHIKCECVVGHSDLMGTDLRKKVKMNVKNQNYVLNKFRQGTLNILVSTSVLEEGLDIPKCNMVVRFDFPQNLRSYVQSKGRARAKDSKYILLIPRDNAFELEQQLEHFNCLVEQLKVVCHGRHVADEEAILNQLRDVVQPYENSCGAKATIDSSLSIVYG